MKRLALLAIIATGTLSLSSVAVADTHDAIKAKFTYDASASVQENYARFEKKARKACAVSLKDAGSIANKRQIEAECYPRLLSSAVDSAGRTELSALHGVEIGADAKALMADAR